MVFRRWCTQVAVSSVVGDADDPVGEGLRSVADDDGRAYRVAPHEVVARKGLADDRDEWAVDTVRGIELTATPESDSGGRKVVRRYQIAYRRRLFIGRRVIAGYADRSLPKRALADDGRIERHCRARNAGDAPHALQQRLAQLDQSARFVRRLPRVDVGEQRLCRRVRTAEPLEVAQRGNEQRGRADQHECER